MTAREAAELDRKEAEARRVLGEIREKLDAAQAKLAAEEAAVEARHLDHLRESKALESKARELSEMQDALRKLEEERAGLLREAAEEGARREAVLAEIEKAEGSIPTLEADAEKALAEARETGEALEAGQTRLDESREHLEVYRKTRRENSEAAESLRETIHEETKRRAALAGQVEGHADREADDGRRLEDIGRKREELEARRAALISDIEAKMREARELRARVETLAEEMRERAEELGRVREMHTDTRDALDKARGGWQRVHVLLDSLVAVKERQEGSSESVRRLLEEKSANGSARVPGVLGMLTDVMETDAEYEAALEAALGERVQGVLLERREHCLAAADFLREGEGGRSTFIPLELRAPDTDYPQHTLGRTRGPLLDVVRCEERYAPVARTLLDGVLLVDTLEEALTLHTANGYHGAFVTRQGDFVHASGIVSGGGRAEGEGGALARNRRIRELTAELEGLTVRRDEAQDRFTAAEAELRRVEAVWESLRPALDEAHEASSRSESALRRAHDEETSVAQQLDELAERERAIFEARAAREEASAKASAEVGEVDERIARARADLQVREDALYEGARQFEALQEEVTERSAEVAGLRERRKAALDRETSLRWTLQKVREDLSARRASVEESERRIARAREGVERVEAALGERAGEIVRVQETLARARGDQEAREEELARADAGLRVLRKDVEGHKEELSRQDVSLVEYRMKRDHLSERLTDRYNIALAELPEECGKDDSVDVQVMAERRRELIDKIEKIGPVNVDAIEEHAEQTQRLDFYTTQKTDLESAMADLQQAIGKINKESRERFIRTFAAVAEKFAAVLPSLFGGGSAKLELTDPNDPLESGIDISIQPPGKRLTNITLLSGGEKAMSSIGLIFSIFLIKPSPFCLLDEVDAPLDDANVDRFNNLMHMVREHSQVILITHNKRTMRIAETLYGVSMQEAGVSKLVSVRFAEDETMIGDDLPDDTAAVMH
ncbi:MAG: chromosome segregation protein SMC [Deltaproteobacteria bacterium]|nr:chromosome segregation protein SMC [Deltaproteobacteria bacterium]